MPDWIVVTQELVLLMRQLQKKFTDRLPNHPIFLPQIDAEAAPIGVAGAATRLRGGKSVAEHSAREMARHRRPGAGNY
jgi:hypothetical protein